MAFKEHNNWKNSFLLFPTACYLNIVDIFCKADYNINITGPSHKICLQSKTEWFSVLYTEHSSRMWASLHNALFCFSKSFPICFCKRSMHHSQSMILKMIHIIITFMTSSSVDTVTAACFNAPFTTITIYNTASTSALATAYTATIGLLFFFVLVFLSQYCAVLGRHQLSVSWMEIKLSEYSWPSSLFQWSSLTTHHNQQELLCQDSYKSLHQN